MHAKIYNLTLSIYIIRHLCLCMCVENCETILICTMLHWWAKIARLVIFVKNKWKPQITRLSKENIKLYNKYNKILLRNTFK